MGRIINALRFLVCSPLLSCVVAQKDAVEGSQVLYTKP